MGASEGQHGLRGRTAVVTGASSDLGLAVGERLRGLGAHVVGLGRDTARLAAFPGERLVLDLLDPGLAERVLEAAPSIDVLVHVATAHPQRATLSRVRPEELDEAFRVTVGSLVALARAAAPGMKERGFGRVIAVGSAAGALGGPGQLAYASAKAALVGAVRTLAVELGPSGITANLVVPGLVDTARTRAAVPPEVREHLARQAVLGRAGTLDEVAAMVAQLASPEGGYVTGAVIEVDGGLGLGAGLATLRGKA